MKKILIIDDNQENLEAARIQLGNEYEITTASSANEARCLLTGEFDERKFFNLFNKKRLEAGMSHVILDECVPNLKKEISEWKEKRKEIIKKTGKINEEVEKGDKIYGEKKRDLFLLDGFGSIGNRWWTDERKSLVEDARKEVAGLPRIKFDIVMTDCFMPGEGYGQGAGRDLIGEEMPAGLVLAILAMKKEIPQIFIVSDKGHHDSPIAWLMDSIMGPGKIAVGCIIDRNNDVPVKDWKKTIEKFSS